MHTAIKELICKLKQDPDKPRDARFELLCVIAMLLIVTCHVSMYLDQCLGVRTARGLLTGATPISTMYHIVADAGQIGAGLFVLFMRAKPMVRNNITAKLIRIAGASTFGVYLLHEHKFLLLSIYNNINHFIDPIVETWRGSFKLLVLIGVGIALFIVCAIIAIICDHLFVNRVVKKLLSFKSVKRLCDKTDNLVNA